jgi:hypothetical protein
MFAMLEARMLCGLMANVGGREGLVRLFIQ